MSPEDLDTKQTQSLSSNIAWRLTFAELEAFTGLFLTWLLTFNHAGVTGSELLNF
jgi:hypothetical protein